MTYSPVEVSEDAMLAWLCEEVKRRYPKVRFPNPDYRKRHFYGEQWRCHGRVGWWKKGGDLEPILVVRIRSHVNNGAVVPDQYYVDKDSIDPRWVKQLTEVVYVCK